MERILTLIQMRGWTAKQWRALRLPSGFEMMPPSLPPYWVMHGFEWQLRRKLPVS